MRSARKRQSGSLERCSKAGRREWSGAALLDEVLLGHVVDFLGAADWIAARATARHWQLACDRGGPWRFQARLSSACSATRKCAQFARLFGHRVKHLNLNSVTTKVDALVGLLGACPSLESLYCNAMSPRFWAPLDSADNWQSLTVVDAKSSLGLPRAMRKDLRVLALWQASGVREHDVRQLIGPATEELYLSCSPLVGDGAVRALAQRKAQLRIMVLRSVRSLTPTVVHAALEAAAATLRVLDLSGSLPAYQVFPRGTPLASLECLISDDNFVDLSALIAGAPRLKLVSLRRCKSVSDDWFPAHALASGQLLPALRALRLSGTRVTDMAITHLGRLPHLRVIEVDSCRGVSRRLRLELGAANARHDLRTLAPDLPFAEVLLA